MLLRSPTGSQAILRFMLSTYSKIARYVAHTLQNSVPKAGMIVLELGTILLNLGTLDTDQLAPELHMLVIELLDEFGHQHPTFLEGQNDKA